MSQLEWDWEVDEWAVEWVSWMDNKITQLQTELVYNCNLVIIINKYGVYVFHLECVEIRCLIWKILELLKKILYCVSLLFWWLKNNCWFFFKWRKHIGAFLKKMNYQNQTIWRWAQSQDMNFSLIHIICQRNIFRRKWPKH